MGVPRRTRRRCFSFKDLIYKDEFAGSESELDVIVAQRKARAELRKSKVLGPKVDKND